MTTLRTGLRSRFLLLPLLGVFTACGAPYQAKSSRSMAGGNFALPQAPENLDIDTGTSSGPGQVAAERIPTVPGGIPSAQPAQALVIEAFLDLQVDEVDAFANALRARVKAMGGIVVRENSSGANLNYSHSMKVRIPPQKVDEMMEWTSGAADIMSKRIEAEDVSKKLFDQELAIANLTKTMERMQKILDREDLNIDAVLKIEAELNRVRSQIETIKGENRFLKDRVSHATVEFTIARKDGALERPSTKFEIGVQGATLSLLDPGGRQNHRQGLGLLIGSSEVPHMSYELQIFEKVDQNKRAFLATMGGTTFSDNFGGGRRTWLNPFLGLRMGYGRLDGSNFVLAAEAGVEIFKSKIMSAGVNARGTAFFGKGGPDLAVVSAAELRLSF